MVDRRRDTVIYDEGCALCRRTVRWIRRRNTDGVLRMVPADSAQARCILGRPELTGADIDGVVLVEKARAGRVAEPQRVFSGGEAVRRIADRLGDQSLVMRIVRGLPRGMRNSLYKVMARLRRRDGAPSSQDELARSALDDGNGSPP